MIDVTGQTFGRWKALRPSSRRSDCIIMWWCECECGTVREVNGVNLRKGRTLSCGCRWRRGNKKCPEYSVWKQIKTRCTNPNSKDWARYGGRGISMAKCWAKDFARFKQDVGPRPPGYTIERIDINKGYAPGNCKWIPAPLQGKNTSRCILVTLQGERDTVRGWCLRLGVSLNKVYKRIHRGWRPVDALTK